MKTFITMLIRSTIHLAVVALLTLLFAGCAVAPKTENLFYCKMSEEQSTVYEQVKAGTGQFQVDMVFVGEVPKDIRVGQTLQIRLALSDPTQAVLLPKGGFFQTTGGNWIFKLDPGGKVAYRQDIQINRSSPDYYEVIGGLKPGDKVITSSYDTYGDNQELVLK